MMTTPTRKPALQTHLVAMQLMTEMLNSIGIDGTKVTYKNKDLGRYWFLRKAKLRVTFTSISVALDPQLFELHITFYTMNDHALIRLSVNNRLKMTKETFPRKSISIAHWPKDYSFEKADRIVEAMCKYGNLLLNKEISPALDVETYLKTLKPIEENEEG
jgi:hypothetical protein